MTTLKDELEKTASKLRAAIDRKDEEMIAFFLDAIILLKVSDPQILAESSAAGTVIAVRKVTTSASTNAKARALFRRWKQILEDNLRQSTKAANNPIQEYARQDHERTTNTMIKDKHIEAIAQSACKTTVPAVQGVIDHVATLPYRSRAPPSTAAVGPFVRLSSAPVAVLPRPRSTRRGPVPTLKSLCVQVLLCNIDSIQHVGDLPAELLMPVLRNCTWKQLLRIESYNAHFIMDTPSLWRKHLESQFKKCAAPLTGDDDQHDWRAIFLEQLRLQNDRIEQKVQRVRAAAMDEQRASKVIRLSSAESTAIRPMHSSAKTSQSMKSHPLRKAIEQVRRHTPQLYQKKK